MASMRSLEKLKWRMPRDVPAMEHDMSEGITGLSANLGRLTHLQLSIGAKVAAEAVASLARLTCLQVCSSSPGTP